MSTVRMGTCRGFGVAGKVRCLGLGGGHKVGVHFTVIHDVMLKSEVRFRIMAALGGEKYFSDVGVVPFPAQSPGYMTWFSY